MNVLEELRKNDKDFAEALAMWRAEDPERRQYLYPSRGELVSFLMGLIKRDK